MVHDLIVELQEYLQEYSSQGRQSSSFFDEMVARQNEKQRVEEQVIQSEVRRTLTYWS